MWNREFDSMTKVKLGIEAEMKVNVSDGWITKS